MPSSLSVIIPAYNDLVSVMTCLTSLQQYASREVPIEFIVQDDASPDVFLPAVIPFCAASVARNPDNLGFSGNCNAGAARAQGDVLFFVNQDVFGTAQDASGNALSLSWDKALMAAFEDTSVGIAGIKLLFPDGRIQSAGGLFDAHSQPFHRCLGYSNHLYSEVNTPEYVSWVTAAAIAVRRDVFTELGGFDMAYSPSYFEDVDLCLRARELGYKVWYEPRCQLVHRVGSTGGSKYFMRSATTFYERWVVTKKLQPDISVVKERWW